jgi:hypothetical protein
MQNNLKRHESVRAASTVGRQRMPTEDCVNIGPAMARSYVTRLYGRPYPVQFREQGAIEAWTRALEHTELWRCWQEPGTQCWQIRQDLRQQLERRQPLSPESSKLIAEDRRRLAVEVSTNLKYHLSQGTVIEATPALETLLANSDVDLSLPMSMVAPPYQAQYLRFGDAAMRYLGVPASQAADHFFEGVFCFLSRQALSRAPAGNCWTLELVFISKREDSYGGHVSLLGNTDRGDLRVGEWLTRVLGAVRGNRETDIHRSMHVAVSYVVRVFLYMALKQARVMQHREYDDALCRAAGLGERKRVKLLRRSAALYNRILVGPESLPPSASSGVAGSGVAPHWRRGHFRMQPWGTGNQQRKLIFVAPVLIHAEQLQGDVPAPKSYRAGASAAAVT